MMTPRHNLPAQLSSFVGREREIAGVRRLLANGRLVTLTGAGGCGKTRLAIEVAAEVASDFGDGVWLVELAPLGVPVLIEQAIAVMLGVREAPGSALRQTLLEYLVTVSTLLRNMYGKVGVGSRAAAARFAVEQGLV
jgi:hypothetical protein